MKVAYADPPYVGQSKKHYEGKEVNYPVLIETLERDYDGWALSCSSPSLQYLLPLCPEGIRVMAWVKPFCSFKPGVNPAYAWEPVLVKPARKLGREIDTVRDWVSVNITLQRGTHGAKPDTFCLWLFSVLGLQSDDEFVDMFPGSGAVTRAYDQWKSRMF